MRLVKMLVSVLFGIAGLVSVSTFAAIEKVPVSCNWGQIALQSGPYTKITTFQCVESNGNVAATRSLTYAAPTWQMVGCSITTHGDVKYSGTCQSSSLYREKITPDLICNSGAYIGSGCANSMTGSPNFPLAVQHACGSSSCQVRFDNYGATNGCWRESPYLKAYCK